MAERNFEVELGRMFAEAPALPDESSTTSATPSSFSLLMSTMEPLSLNEPVGIRWSILRKTRAP